MSVLNPPLNAPLDGLALAGRRPVGFIWANAADIMDAEIRAKEAMATPKKKTKAAIEAEKSRWDASVASGAADMLALLGGSNASSSKLMGALIDSAIEADRPRLVERLCEISLGSGLDGLFCGGSALSAAYKKAKDADAPGCVAYLGGLAILRGGIEGQASAEEARLAESLAQRLRGAGLSTAAKVAAPLSVEDASCLMCSSVVAKDKRGRGPLMVAAAHGLRERAEELLISGAKLDAGDANGVTALMTAAGRADVEMVKLLLAHGASTEARDYRGATAACYACSGKMDDPAALLALADAGALLDGNPSKDEREYRPSPLHGAAWEGHVLITQALLSRGAKIDALLPDGSTALMRAAMRGNQEAMVVLLRAGANVDLRDQNKKSAIDWAIESRSPLADSTRSMLLRLPYELVVGEARASRASPRI